MQDRKDLIVKLYDSLIDKLPACVNSNKKKIYPYSGDNTWEESQDYEFILQRDTAFELGGSGCNSVNLTLVTTNSDLVKEDRTVVIGKELQDITGNTSYARIAIVRVKENELYDSDSKLLYQLISDIDFVKYHTFMKGFMLRNSSRTNREQVRVGKKELKQEMTFEQIGNTIIRNYKKNVEVLNVEHIFITGDNADYPELLKLAMLATEIRRSLTEISKYLPTECSTCGIREICDEVEGLKELHFGKRSIKNKQQVIL